MDNVRRKTGKRRKRLLRERNPRAVAADLLSEVKARIGRDRIRTAAVIRVRILRRTHDDRNIVIFRQIFCVIQYDICHAVNNRRERIV